MTSVSTSKRGFKWSFNPNFGAVFNQLIDKVRGRDKVLRDEITFKNYLNGNIDISGKPVGTFYSYRFKGLSPDDGRPMFHNTDAKVVIDGKEVSNWERYSDMSMHEVMTTVMMESGTRDPFLQGGIQNTFSWRGWVLSFNIAYSIGSKVRLFKMYPKVSEGGTSIGQGPEENVRREFVSRWRKPGDELKTNVPGLLDSEVFEESVNMPWWKNIPRNKFADNVWQMYDHSDLRVARGDYLRLQTIGLRYTLPDVFCKYLHLKTAYLRVSGNNIFTWSDKKLKGQDPSQSGSASNMGVSIRPTYSVQLNITL